MFSSPLTISVLSQSACGQYHGVLSYTLSGTPAPLNKNLTNRSEPIGNIQVFFEDQPVYHVDPYYNKYGTETEGSSVYVFGVYYTTDRPFFLTFPEAGNKPDRPGSSL